MSDASNIPKTKSVNEKTSPITGYGGLASFFVAIAAFLFPQLVAGLGLSIYTSAGNSFSQKNIMQYFVLDLSIEILTLATLAMFLRRHKKSIKDLLGTLKDKVQLFWVPLTFIVYLMSVTIAYTIVQTITKSVDLNQEQDNAFKAAASHPQIALAFVALVVVTPIVEEMVFRGFLYRGLRSSIGKVGAAIIASLLFGFAHGQINVGIDTFILSLFLIALLEKTNSLIPSILLHAIKNFFAFLIIFSGRF